MKKVFRNLLLGFFLVTNLNAVIYGDELFSWDFENAFYKDILYAVSLDTGLSICCDDTVDGKGDFKFVGKDFNQAFDSFLLKNRLFVEKNDDLWIVSKFRLEEVNGFYNLDAYDMSPVQILEKLDLKIEGVILFDVVPNVKLSLHFTQLSVDDLLEKLALRFGNYTVLKIDSGYQFCKKVEQKKLEVENGYVRIEKENELCKVDVKNSKFSEVVEKILDYYSEKKYELCWLCENDILIKRVIISAGSFDDLMGKICFQNGYDFILNEGIYYLFNSTSKKDEIINGKKEWTKYNLKFSTTKEVLPIVLARFGKLENFHGKDEYCFFAKVTEAENLAILDLINEFDKEENIYVLNLKYEKATDFLEQLPSFIDKSKVFAGENNSKLYFKGSEEDFRELEKNIQLFDDVETRLSYDLLILQYDESKTADWSLNFTQREISLGDRTGIVSQLGSVMSLNLNVLTTFGLNFAQKLQGSLEKNQVNVFADTTLYGTNGKEISFQSTNTYRYRDNNLDPETGKPVYSGITKEICSGIKIELTGWVSGEGLITTNITTSISRQGSDLSSTTGNPPPTTEKLVTTEVCSKNGEPVILSGLNQDSFSSYSNSIFGKAKNKEKSQLVIYLIPHVENPLESKVSEKEKSKKISSICKKIEEEKELLKSFEGVENNGKLQL